MCGAVIYSVFTFQGWLKLAIQALVGPIKKKPTTWRGSIETLLILTQTYGMQNVKWMASIEDFLDG